jgi:pectate lyase
MTNPLLHGAVRHAAAALLALATLPAAAATDPAREAAPADGWAAMAGGTTGGAAATAEQIYTVGNRSQLLAALSEGGARAKIVKVVGAIDMSDGVPYTGRADQDLRAMVRLPSNTTLIGAGPGTGLVNGRIEIIGVSNVIVRNLRIVAPCDVAPVWDPSDGATGSWNAAYDAITVLGADHIWIDRNTITDAPTTDDTLPVENGKTRQCHDGAIDITRGGDYVTVSYNLIDRHDKTMLIGHSDSYTADIGRLRVTIANNVFSAVSQRAPRVRFGQVHLYDNLYDVRATPSYVYTWGVGIESAIFAEENFFIADRSFTVDQIIERFNGTTLSASGTLVVGPRVRNPVDVISAWNAVNDPDLGFDAGWTPTLNFELLPAWTTALLVPLFAGPFH